MLGYLRTRKTYQVVSAMYGTISKLKSCPSFYCTRCENWEFKDTVREI